MSFFSCHVIVNRVRLTLNHLQLVVMVKKRVQSKKSPARRPTVAKKAPRYPPKLKSPEPKSPELPYSIEDALKNRVLTKFNKSINKDLNDTKWQRETYQLIPENVEEPEDLDEDSSKHTNNVRPH
jgi:hypothetical protein